MSTLTCLCGHILKDDTWPPPYDSGMILGDEDEALIRLEIAKELVEFISSIQQGKRDEWLQKHFATADNDFSYYQNDEEIIDDFLMVALRPYQRVIDQCDQCGRLWVQQQPGQNIYRSFTLEDEWHHVLRDVGPKTGIE